MACLLLELVLLTLLLLYVQVLGSYIVLQLMPILSELTQVLQYATSVLMRENVDDLHLIIQHHYYQALPIIIIIFMTYEYLTHSLLPTFTSNNSWLKSSFCFWWPSSNCWNNYVVTKYNNLYKFFIFMFTCLYSAMAASCCCLSSVSCIIALWYVSLAFQKKKNNELTLE